jgi:hypothetical protein
MTSLAMHSTFGAADRSFSKQVSIAARILVALPTRRVAAWSKLSQHFLSRCLLSMASVSRRSWPDHWSCGCVLQGDARKQRWDGDGQADAWP